LNHIAKCSIWNMIKYRLTWFICFSVHISTNVSTAFHCVTVNVKQHFIRLHRQLKEHILLVYPESK